MAGAHRDPRRIEPLERPFRVALTPPGSKSLTNRCLLLAALGHGRSTLHRPLQAQDTQVMVGALRQLGIDIESTDDADGQWKQLEIDGRGGALHGGGAIDLMNAGTAVRFLTAACVLADAPVVIEGSERMRQRPIGELVQMLRSVGAAVEYVDREGYPPVRVHPGVLRGGEVRIGPTLSGQFVSALLMLGPFMKEGLSVRVTGPLTSPGYIAMTLGCMERFGATIESTPALDRIDVAMGTYESVDVNIEPDASSATYFLAAAALSPGSTCTIEGLGKGSVQPDLRIADALHEMGANLTFGRDFVAISGPTEPLRGVDIDCADMPDAAMTLAVAAAFAKGETVLRGLATLQHKESKRLTALQTELAKLGAAVEIEDDELLVIEPATNARQRADEVCIETYDDHRMAMSFAVAGLARAGVSIANPQCVSKTFPAFWDELARLRESPSVDE